MFCQILDYTQVYSASYQCGYSSNLSFYYGFSVVSQEKTCHQRHNLAPVYCNPNSGGGEVRKPTLRKKRQRPSGAPLRENISLCKILCYPKILQNTTEIDLLTYLGHCDLL